MSLHQVKGLEHFSDSIPVNTGGIIWLTDEPLDLSSPGLYEFNYLLDGMILKSIQYADTLKNSHFFLGESFGEPIFIAHIQVQQKDDIKKLNEHLIMAKSIIKTKNTVFIFNKAKNTANINLLKEFRKQYPDYHFEILNL